MNKEEKLDMLKSYITNNVAPILTDFLDEKDISDSVILPANIDIKELNGHYENTTFTAPSWFNELTNKKILVISNLDSITKEEQLKFIELFKYRKIATFELPKDIVIIVTAKKISKETIKEEIYSLVAHI